MPDISHPGGEPHKIQKLLTFSINNYNKPKLYEMIGGRIPSPCIHRRGRKSSFNKMIVTDKLVFPEMPGTGVCVGIYSKGFTR